MFCLDYIDLYGQQHCNINVYLLSYTYMLQNIFLIAQFFSLQVTGLLNFHKSHSLYRNLYIKSCLMQQTMVMELFTINPLASIVKLSFLPPEIDIWKDTLREKSII